MTVEDLNPQPASPEDTSAATTDIANALNDAPADDQPQPSEDEQMGAAYDKAMSGDTEDAGDDSGGERVRDPATGRFVAQEAKEGEGGREEQTSLEGEEGAETEEGSTASEVSAPAHMPQALKASWDKIPEDARKAIVDNDKEWSRKFGDMGRQIEQVRPISDALARTMENAPIFKGMTVEQIAKGASELAAVQAKLQSADPMGRVDIIMQIANHAGVLPQLHAMLTGKQPSEHDNSVFEKINGLEERVQQITPEQIEQQISSAMQLRDTETSIDRFAGEKHPDTGQPLRPFWKDVEASMPAYISMVKERHPDGIGLTECLTAAYDMAINADPVLRQKVREQEAAATSSQPDTKRQDAAKKAASINVKSSTNGKPPQLTEEQQMGAAYDRLMSA